MAADDRYISLGGLTHYDEKIKEYAKDHCAVLEDANWQKTEAAGAVSFLPAPEMQLDPVVNFKFTETGPAEGTKSPDNPSTIEGVSSIGVGVHGKNLFRYAKTGTYAQVSVSVDADGAITLNGTCNAAAGVSVYINDYTYYTPYIPVNTQKYLVAKIEHISGSYTGETSFNQIFGVELVDKNLNTNTVGYEWIQIYSTDGDTAIKTWNYPSFNLVNNAYTMAVLILFGGVSYNNYKIKVQYEFSDTLTPSNYESPIISPYTLSLNGTYYGGSVDLSTGIMTVTWEGVAFDGTENWGAHPTIENCYQLSLSKKHFDDGFGFSCTHFLRKTSSIDEGCYITRGFCYLYKDFANVADLKSFLSAQSLAGTPVTIAYTLLSPYTVQLTPTQIKSLPALSKYEPRTNTVYSDQESVQVGYPKSSIATDNELTNAIISLGGNV